MHEENYIHMEVHDSRMADKDAEIDRLRAEVAELTHKILCCGVAASHSDKTLSERPPYSTKWDSPQAEEVRVLRRENEAMKAEVAELRAAQTPRPMSEAPRDGTRRVIRVSWMEDDELRELDIDSAAVAHIAQKALCAEYVFVDAEIEHAMVNTRQELIEMIRAEGDSWHTENGHTWNAVADWLESKLLPLPPAPTEAK